MSNDLEALTDRATVVRLRAAKLRRESKMLREVARHLRRRAANALVHSVLVRSGRCEQAVYTSDFDGGERHT